MKYIETATCFRHVRAQHPNVVKCCIYAGHGLEQSLKPMSKLSWRNTSIVDGTPVSRLLRG